jgi:hypothetical protein
MLNRRSVLILGALLTARLLSGQAAPSVTIDLPIATQGPIWPPSAIVDKDGNFVVIGIVLKQFGPSTIIPAPNQAVLVSKETVPPLKNGVEDPSNWFGAPYKVIRSLDLSPGSPDLDMVMYSSSYGPVGNSKSPRIPQVGESTYNLNGNYVVCPELFPSTTQRSNWTRPSYPLHQVPVWGFQGDQVQYDPNDGTARPAHAATGPGCPFDGCPGEDNVDSRRTDPITLGEWIKARGTVRITLAGFSPEVNAYTAARFEFKLRNLLPRSLYTIGAVRPRTIPNAQRDRKPIGPLTVPNVLVTDSDGNVDATFEVPNPFPDPDNDPSGLRIIALSVVFHSDHQNWGACFDVFGSGVSAHAVFNTLVNGTADITPFITKAHP